MEVVLLEDVKALGKKGQVVKVNDGYARNFILPKKLGVEATSKNLNDLKLQKANAEKVAAEQLAEAKKLAEEIDKMSVTVSIKAGEGGRAFGSVSTKEIAKAAKDQLKLDIDKKKMVLPEPIKSIGSFEVPIKLHKEVTARLIVKVSAKDLGTGKEQNITITASTNMSKDDIDKAVKEAEQFAADDKKKREEVDIRNGADQMVFQTEKMLKENGDKMPADVKSEAEAKLADLKTAVQSGSIDDIKAKQDALSHVFEKMYQAAAAAQQQAAGAQPGPDAGANDQQKPGDDGVVDADFKEV